MEREENFYFEIYMKCTGSKTFKLLISKNKIHHRNLSVTFAKFFRRAILQDTCERLHMKSFMGFYSLIYKKGNSYRNTAQRFFSIQFNFCHEFFACHINIIKICLQEHAKKFESMFAHKIGCGTRIKTNTIREQLVFHKRTL